MAARDTHQTLTARLLRWLAENPQGVASDECPAIFGCTKDVASSMLGYLLSAKRIGSIPEPLGIARRRLRYFAKEHVPIATHVQFVSAKRPSHGKRVSLERGTAVTGKPPKVTIIETPVDGRYSSAGALPIFSGLGIGRYEAREASNGWVGVPGPEKSQEAATWFGGEA